MDLRLGPTPRASILPRPMAEVGAQRTGAVAFPRHSGLRSAVDKAIDQAIGQAKGQAPRAEAVAVRCVERTRPVWSWLAMEWRRLGTLAALLLIVGLGLHATFGANGMVVYRQKRAEMRAIASEVEQLQKENAEYVEQIKALKSDPAAIEKEAREQLHYTRRGEVVYVAPDPPQRQPTSRARSGK